MASPPSLPFSLTVAACLLKPSQLCQAAHHKERRKSSQSLLSAKADLPSLPNHHSLPSPCLIVPFCTLCQFGSALNVSLIEQQQFISSLTGRLEGIESESSNSLVTVLYFLLVNRVCLCAALERMALVKMLLLS